MALEFYSQQAENKSIQRKTELKNPSHIIKSKSPLASRIMLMQLVSHQTPSTRHLCLKDTEEGQSLLPAALGRPLAAAPRLAVNSN